MTPEKKKKVVFSSGNFRLLMVKISELEIAPLTTGNYDSKIFLWVLKHSLIGINVAATGGPDTKRIK